MSRDGPENPTPNPITAIRLTTLHAGTAAVARMMEHSAAAESAHATRRSWRSPCEAKKPPAATPAALASRYAVSAVVAKASVTPYALWKIAGAKFCNPPNAITATKKNAKHIHTTGTPRNAKEPPRRLLSGARSDLASCSVRRLAKRKPNARKPTIEAPAHAARQPHVSAMASTNTGAAAQPRLP